MKMHVKNALALLHSSLHSVTVWSLPIQKEIIVSLTGGECYEANQPCNDIITFLQDFYLPVEDCHRLRGFVNEGKHY